MRAVSGGWGSVMMVVFVKVSTVEMRVGIWIEEKKEM